MLLLLLSCSPCSLCFSSCSPAPLLPLFLLLHLLYILLLLLSYTSSYFFCSSSFCSCPAPFLLIFGPPSSSSLPAPHVPAPASPPSPCPPAFPDPPTPPSHATPQLHPPTSSFIVIFLIAKYATKKTPDLLPLLSLARNPRLLSLYWLRT